MEILQIHPGMLPIPPVGWGATEKVIWNYKLQLDKKGHPTKIEYLDYIIPYKVNFTHFHMANLALQGHSRGIPYVFSLHDHHTEILGKDSEVYKKNLLAIKNSIFSITHNEKYVELFDETDKLFYLPHGVDTELYNFKDKNFEEHSLLCIANNGILADQSFDRKGFRYAIEAAINLNLKITIVGPENNMNFFNQNSDLLSYEKLEIIRHNPSEEEIIKLYQEHTIFLHPSMYEAGQPNLTIVESLSCGTPVVGTFEGTSLPSGMIKIERNTESVINGINECINNYDYYINLTKNTKKDYDWSVIVDKLIKMYESIEKIKTDYNSEETKNLYLNSFEDIKNTNKDVVNIGFNFIDGPYVNLSSTNLDEEYRVEFIDDDTNEIKFQTYLKNNMWAQGNIKYFVKWRIKVYKGEEVVSNYLLNYKDKRVYISFESKSLGDNIAWMPYVDEFRRVYDCKVVVSTFWNKFFRTKYPQIDFVNPGEVVSDITGLYRLGWFWDNTKEPENPVTIPLQKAATNILGLDYFEIRPRIEYEVKERPIDKKYITIATDSTAGLKYWNHPNGWETLVSYLIKLGYEVINVSKEQSKIDGVINVEDTSIENTMNIIHHSEFLIGLSSGLSWLAWAMGTHVVMISNFTEENHEFTSNCSRINNKEVCNGCWNNPMFKFDKGDWYWCPEHKGTDRQFECHKSITPEMVLQRIQHLI